MKNVRLEYYNNRIDQITVVGIKEGQSEKIKVGYLTLKDGYLYYLGLLSKYQGLDIETKLLKLALKNYPSFKIACVKQSRAYFYSLSEIEEKAVANCVREGLISEDRCVFDKNAADILYVDGVNEGALRQDSLLVREAFDYLKTLHQPLKSITPPTNPVADSKMMDNEPLNIKSPGM